MNQSMFSMFMSELCGKIKISLILMILRMLKLIMITYTIMNGTWIELHHQGHMTLELQELVEPMREKLELFGVLTLK